MSLQYLRAKPLQASKLPIIIVSLLFTTASIFGFVGGRGLDALLFLVVLSFSFVVVITAATVYAGYQCIHATGSLADQLAKRPVYNIVRAIEVSTAAISMGAFVAIIVSLPDGPMAGPGAIGLLFIIAGLGLLILTGSLIRTISEYYYYYRRTDPR